MQLIGLVRLGRDAEVRYTPAGDAVMSFTGAYNYGKKADNGERKTQWVSCTVWGERAKALAPYMLKGTQVMVTLRDVNVREWESRDKQGYSLEGTVSELEFAGGTKREGDSATERQTHTRQQEARGEAHKGHQTKPAKSSTGFDDMDDDIPF